MRERHGGSRRRRDAVMSHVQRVVTAQRRLWTFWSQWLGTRACRPWDCHAGLEGRGEPPAAHARCGGSTSDTAIWGPSVWSHG